LKIHWKTNSNKVGNLIHRLPTLFKFILNLMKKKIWYSVFAIAASSTLFYCKTNKQPLSNSPAHVSQVAKEIKNEIDFSKSPFVSASASIQKMQIEDGFEVKLIASEPLVNTPVAMIFDDQARMWVIEMTSYMPDSLGNGEDVPNGKIVILTDNNKDGIYDQRRVIIDSLVMPRAICLIDNGILVAEPTNLWFYELDGDRAGKRVLVDDEYAVGGNVEHQPNGLLRTLDNWIYNAKSTKRYRKIGNEWKIERTHFRGQWGIAQDNYGRVYYNHNSQNLMGDFFSPGFGSNNPNQRSVAGYGEKTVVNNKVYPIRPTPGVNRGYMKGILNDSLKLNEFTAASAPVIYRGDLFGKAYDMNAFVPEPSANLIKRNILHEKGYLVNGDIAYKGKEFLASTDERFRPVSLYNGPDGALYIVDMYRGIIQHKTYLTPYLKDQIGQRDLTLPLSAGRIYKVIPKNKVTSPTLIPDDPEQLVTLLGSANGWVRDKAQQKLIDKKYLHAVPALKIAMNQTEKPLLAIHAMWTLEGLKVISAEEVLKLLNTPVWPIRMQALTAVPSLISKSNYTKFASKLDQMVTDQDTLAAPYVGYLCAQIKQFDIVQSTNILKKLATSYPQNIYVADAIISNLNGREEIFLNNLASLNISTETVLFKQLTKVVGHIKSAKSNRDPALVAKQYPKGVNLYTTICQTCHGTDGNGVKSLGPPLNQSEWVVGQPDKLMSIVLFGLTGPVTVQGHVYQAPEINGDMPGIGYDPDIKDAEIAELLSYIRKSWRNDASDISESQIKEVRKKYKSRQAAFTEKELLSM
jgi:mono/diheme cytochrome c family protein